MQRKIIPLILSVLGILLQSRAAKPYALSLGPSGFTPGPIPLQRTLLPSLLQADLDGNGVPEILALKDSRLDILSGDLVVWNSPPEWQVAQAAFSDLDRNGVVEVTLLLWRPFRPWPVDEWLPNDGRIKDFHNATGQSCHIILIGWRQGAFREIWAGSAMADPVTAFANADLDGDGFEELVTLENRYTDPDSASARVLKAWEWNGFGFTVVSYRNGSYNKMTLIRDDTGQVLILVP
jgi:hypothetical protein